jgi:transcriptional regulator with XRE-family HTH domain
LTLVRRLNSAQRGVLNGGATEGAATTKVRAGGLKKNMLVKRQTSKHIHAMKNSKTDPKSASSLDTHKGGRIREARLASGTSQVSLGEAVGVTFQQMQKYETGRNRISAARLFLVCQLLQVPITSMFEGYDSNPSGADKTKIQKEDVEQAAPRAPLLFLA